VANVNNAYSVNEFTFRQFDRERGLASDAWEAKNEVVAANFREAFSRSRQALIPLVDVISFVTQSSASLLATSHFVYRLEQNDDRLMFLYVARRTAPVGMPLGDAEQVRDIQKLLALHGSAVNYLREANNASTAKTQLAMLVIAAEALAICHVLSGHKKRPNGSRLPTPHSASPVRGSRSLPFLSEQAGPQRRRWRRGNSTQKGPAPESLSPGASGL